MASEQLPLYKPTEHQTPEPKVDHSAQQASEKKKEAIVPNLLQPESPHKNLPYALNQPESPHKNLPPELKRSNPDPNAPELPGKLKESKKFTFEKPSEKDTDPNAPKLPDKLKESKKFTFEKPSEKDIDPNAPKLFDKLKESKKFTFEKPSEKDTDPNAPKLPDKLKESRKFTFEKSREKATNPEPQALNTPAKAPDIKPAQEPSMQQANPISEQRSSLTVPNLPLENAQADRNQASPILWSNNPEPQFSQNQVPISAPASGVEQPKEQVAKDAPKVEQPKELIAKDTPKVEQPKEQKDTPKVEQPKKQKDTPKVEQSADPAKAAQKETEKPQAPKTPKATQPEKKQEKGGVEGWVSKQLDWYEKGRDDVNQILVDKVKGVPVLEQAAQSYKWFDNQQAQLSSGFVKGGAALVDGVVTMVSNPVQTAKGLFAMAEHVPVMNGLMPNPMKLVHGLYDITVNKEDAKTVAYRVFDTKHSMQEDAQFWKTVGSAFIAPYKESIDKGRYSEAAGRGIFDIGSLFIGAGEANVAVKGGSVAGKMAETASVVGKTTEVANVASKTGKTAEVATIAGKATEVANVAGKAEKVSEAATIAGKTEKAAEVATLSEKVVDGSKGIKATEVASVTNKTADVGIVNKGGDKVAKTDPVTLKTGADKKVKKLESEEITSKAKKAETSSIKSEAPKTEVSSSTAKNGKAGKGTSKVNEHQTEEPSSAIDEVKVDNDYGVAFFGESNLKYYSGDTAKLGREGGGFFHMPIEDSSIVTDTADAARYTGMSPSTLKAYVEGGETYGISFPSGGFDVRPPTAVDAGGWPHFLEGGKTAVALEGENAGYLLNPVREFVLPGGKEVPEGSVLFKLGDNGSWVPVRRF
jgi:hypothetical protein